ncbi:MAG: hypothetical protein ABEI31_03965 [Halodesulfurarchaeum sp.]
MGKVALAVTISVTAALAVHYALVAGMHLHPTLHAFAGIVFFFIAGAIMFQVVMF